MKSTYTKDIEFNSAFGVFQAPVHLFTAGVLSGAAPAPINQSFRFLDLACGNGFTLCFLADAYPQAQFVGVDINAAHIASAVALSKQAGLTNIEFYQADVDEIDITQYGMFDYCTVSGVYSWLDIHRQQKVRQFLEQVMRSGALVYLDYSCEPGVSQTATLYQLLTKLSDTQQGNSAEKLSRSISLLNDVKTSGSQFFKENEIAKDRFTSIQANPVEDEAHEILNVQAQTLWSSDVILSMQEHAFDFIGHAALHHNVRDFVSHRPLPDSSKDETLANKEMLMDVINNVGRRKDLYQKRAANGDVNQVNADLMGVLDKHYVYIAPNALSQQSLQRMGKGFPNVDFTQKIFSDIAAAGDSVVTFGELGSHLSTLAYSSDSIQNAIENLLAVRAISIACMPMKSVSIAQRYTIPSTINNVVLREDIGQEHARPFMSQVLGTRLVLSLKDRIYLWAAVGHDLKAAWQAMGDLRQALRDNDGKVLSEDGFVKVIESSMPAFEKIMIPELLRIGIIEPI